MTAITARSNKNRVTKWVVCLSVLFVIISYLQFFLPRELADIKTLTIFWAFFKFGVILLCDEATVILENKSLLHEIVRSGKNFWSFIFAGVIGGIILDGVAVWLGKLWIYPYFNNLVYVLLFAGGFCVYWLFITESYLAAKAILKRLIKKKQKLKNVQYYSFEPDLYKAFGILGPLMAITGIWLILRQYSAYGGYKFSIMEAVQFKVNFLFIALVFFGIWFFFEYIEYSKRKTSLLKDILHDYSIPVWSIILSSIILGLFMESVNLAHNYWAYINWPLESVTVLGLPLTMFLAWPFQYVLFLSLFRAITDKESSDIWN